MSTPFLLCGAALLFWGWQTGHLGVAWLLAAILEMSRFVPIRMDWSDMRMRRVWDLTVLLVVAAGVVSYTLWPVSEAVLAFLQWLPMLFFPFMLAQAYNRPAETNLATFLWWRRRGFGPESIGSRVRLNVSHLYFALCLLASSAVSDWRGSFYAGLCLLCGWALWSARPRRVHDVVAIGLFLGVVAAGSAGHQQLRRWHILLEKRGAEWLRVFHRSAFDDLTAHTSLGRIGELKESRRIVLQLEPKDPDHPPLLLRQSSYNRLYISTWFGARRQLLSILSEGHGTWRLVRGGTAPQTARVFTRLPGGRGLLPLPGATVLIEDLPALDMSCTQYGAVRVEGCPETVHFGICSGGKETLDQAPVPLDLLVPAAEASAVARTAAALGLDEKRSGREVMAILTSFFNKDFRYVPFARENPVRLRPGESLLQPFLLQERRGHCEYFATATVLLLRQAGIPARYAAGFAVLPESRLGNTYLVREKDAHAWALAYVDGQWLDLDTTPGTWVATEAGQASAWAPVWDWWSRTWYRFTWWRSTTSTGALLPYVLTAIGLLTGWLLYQFFSRGAGLRRVRSGRRPSIKTESHPGGDSEFYRIERFLQRHGLDRNRHETFRQWLERVERLKCFPGHSAELATALDLHYRLRFDPAGLDPGQRQALASQVTAWLAACPRPSFPFWRRFRPKKG
jgi:hypothetical protein